jgi:hypothetical protein
MTGLPPPRFGTVGPNSVLAKNFSRFGLDSDLQINPVGCGHRVVFSVAGPRNHVPANRPIDFRVQRSLTFEALLAWRVRWTVPACSLETPV